jgi:GT2 family glycosyltransferase
VLHSRPIAFKTPDRPEVSVLIPTRSSATTLVEVLSALAREAERGAAPFELVVVLNAATPEVRAAVDAVDGGTRVESSVNLGVAGGLNAARRAARGRFLAPLHDDAVPEPGWLDALLDAARRTPRAGIVGSLQLTPTGQLLRGANLVWRDGWTTRAWRTPPPGPDALPELEPADFVGTAAMLVDAALFDEVGGADERLHPAMYVDVDLAFKSRAAGRSVVLAAGARVRHHVSRSTSLPYRTWISLRNRHRVRATWRGALAGRAPLVDSEAAFARARARVAEEAAAIDSGVASPGPVRPGAGARLLGFVDFVRFELGPAAWLRRWTLRASRGASGAR